MSISLERFFATLCYHSDRSEESLLFLRKAVLYSLEMQLAIGDWQNSVSDQLLAASCKLLFQINFAPKTLQEG